MPEGQSPPIPPARARGLTPYIPPVKRPHITLKLDTNEGPAPTESLVAALRELPEDAIRRYPESVHLERTIANHYAVDPARVVVTAGVDDALFRLAAAYAAPGRRCVVTDPTFAIIPRILRIFGTELAEIPWTQGPFPTDAVLAARPDALAFVVAPNNPTGLAATAADVRGLRDSLDAAGLAQTLIVCDFAYIEFADEDPTEDALAVPNTVVLRTLSKAWGLAGLRVGYAICPEVRAAADAPSLALRNVGQPFAVSAPSLAIAGHAFETQQDIIAARVRQARFERDRVREVLASKGIDAGASQANFVLARFATPEDAAALESHLDARGIAVRRYAVAGEPCVRISLPMDAGDMSHLEAALRAFTQEPSVA